jgi:DUF4097 and DUF4098 domain-containing protein YvlB
MRTAFLALLSAVSTAAAQQKIDRRIPIAADVSLRITNQAGLTRIIGWDRDSIAVTGVIPAGASFFMGGQGRLAKLGVERRDESQPEPGATLEVRVPAGARIWIRSVSANVEATGLIGEFECSSAGGTIRVTGALRLVIAESMDGGLEVNGRSDIVRLKGGSGPITLRGIAGDVLATSVGGPITATEGAITRGHLETVSGAVTYEGSVDPRGTLEVVTHSGDVTLRVPGDLAAEFDLESIDGAILSAFQTKPGLAPKPLKGKPLAFANNGGGAHVSVRSFKGEVRLLKP